MSQPFVKTRAPRRAAPKMALAMGKQLARLAETSGAMDPGLISAWPEIVGPDLAKISRPVKLQRKGKSLTLVIAVRSGAAAMRIQYAQTQILAKAVTHLRQPTLKRIAIDQSQGAGPTGDAPRPLKRWGSQPTMNGMLAQDAPPPKAPDPAETVAEALRRLKQSMDRND